MMAVQVTLIPVDQIDPNPWQTRAAEDPAHIERLAASIAETGLRDEPLARHIAETQRYQLAYGHSRLAAFRLLDGQAANNGSFDAIPLKLADLSDLEMFEMAVRENAERKDLNPIEEARAMRRYRDEFGKTSGEIGALFGLAESTVRNKMRLADLPEAVRERVAKRDISEVTARSLLTVQRLAPKVVENLAQELSGDGYETAVAVNRQIDWTLRQEAICMHSKHSGGEPAGGSGLWPLAWNSDVMMTITPKQFTKAFPKYEKSQTLNKSLKQVWLALEASDGDRNWREMEIAYELTECFLEAAVQLINPPACTACSYYGKSNGNHYCGLSACWERKKKLWIETQLEQKAEKMGIPVYDPAEDGKDYEEAPHFSYMDASQWEAWVEAGADHLRLRANYNEYNRHKLTESHCVQLISVRAEIREAAEKERQEQVAMEARGETPEQMRKVVEQRRELALAFLRNQAAVVFGQAFEGLTAGVMEWLLYSVVGPYHFKQMDIPEDPLARVEYMKQLLAYEVIEAPIEWNEMYKGAVHVAGLLVETAKAWEVELPEGWLVMASAYAEDGSSCGTAAEDEGVSAETAEVDDAD